MWMFTLPEKSMAFSGKPVHRRTKSLGDGRKESKNHWFPGKNPEIGSAA